MRRAAIGSSILLMACSSPGPSSGVQIVHRDVYRVSATSDEEAPFDMLDVRLLERHGIEWNEASLGDIRDDGRTTLVPDSSADERWIRFGRNDSTRIQWAELGATTLNLGKFIAGRPGVERATQPTTIILTIDGMSPFELGDVFFGSDFLSIYCYANGHSLFAFVNDSEVEAGATSVTVEWQLEASATYGAQPLLSASHGDTCIIIQQRTEACGEPTRCTNPVAMWRVEGISSLDGQVTAATASKIDFSLAPATTSLLPVAEWVALAPLSDYVVAGLFAGIVDGYAESCFALTWVHANLGPVISGDLEAASINWSMPEEGLFAAGHTVWAGFSDSLVLEGPEQLPYYIQTHFCAARPAEAFASLGPIVGPVTGIRVDGSDGSAGIVGTSSTPTIAWQGPALGTVAYYLVTIRGGIVASGASSRATKFSEVVVSGDRTTLTLPPGVLESAEYYSVVIRAISTRATERTALTLPMGLSEAATPVFLAQ
jgi:hypothetical protein